MRTSMSIQRFVLWATLVTVLLAPTAYVLNHPGNPNNVGSTGMLATRNSGNAARTLQLTLRLSW